MRTYDTLSDWGFDPQNGAPDSVTQTARAVIAVWRYKYPVTYSRQASGSFSPDIQAAVALREPVLVIYEDVASLAVSGTKTNHVSTLSAALRPGAHYLTEIFPGDWMAAWIVNTEVKAQELIARIKNGEACNRFLDGLKFLGRATGLRIGIHQASEGLKTTTYSLTASGFTEFDASIYYEPQLASRSYGLAVDWLKSTGVAINKLIVQPSDPKGGGISFNAALPLLLDAFLGSGAPKNSGFSGGPETTKGLDNPKSLPIPAPIAALLGVKQGTKPNGLFGWNDICDVIWGVQQYQLDVHTPAADTDTAARAGEIFAPDGSTTGLFATGDVQRRRYTERPMLGVFLPTPPAFSGQSTVWSIISRFLNPTINEMYTCLRADPQGNIMPTLVARQLPFSTGVVSEDRTPPPVIGAEHIKKDKNGNPVVFTPPPPRHLTLTRFFDVPRWRIHPMFVRNVDLGRSDALRFNFVHVYGDSGLSNQNRAGYIVRDPPFADDLDILRSGLRPYLSSVNCQPSDARDRRAGDWMHILSDILMGQHLTLTGTMTVVGIQSPICPGDNLEFDDTVLHIESVTHQYTSDDGGRTSFSTVLQLSHGLSVHQDTGQDFALFAGTSDSDLMTYQAPASRNDYQEVKETPNSPPDSGTEFNKKRDDVLERIANGFPNPFDSGDF